MSMSMLVRLLARSSTHANGNRLLVCFVTLHSPESAAAIGNSDSGQVMMRSNYTLVTVTLVVQPQSSETTTHANRGTPRYNNNINQSIGWAFDLLRRIKNTSIDLVGGVVHRNPKPVATYKTPNPQQQQNPPPKKSHSYLSIYLSIPWVVYELRTLARSTYWCGAGLLLTSSTTPLTPLPVVEAY